MIEFYRRMHFDEVEGWICPLAQENYERMVQMKSEETTKGSTPKTKDEIFGIVCGSGYVSGLGHGKIPPSKSSHSYNHRHLEDIRQRAETAERRNEELATQLHDQGLQIEEMNRWRRSIKANMGPLYYMLSTLVMCWVLGMKRYHHRSHHILIIFAILKIY